MSLGYSALMSGVYACVAHQLVLASAARCLVFFRLVVQLDEDVEAWLLASAGHHPLATLLLLAVA